MRKKKIGVLVSGRGSNLQAMIDQINEQALQAEISIVISDKEDAYALERAKTHQLPYAVILRNQFRTKEEFEKELIDQLQAHEIDVVVLAGFMRVLSSYFIQSFSGKIINIHPSLLPSFPGLHAQRQALAYGVCYSGCTVHFVNEEVDGGPIIAQAVVPVLEEDTEETLAERILKEEHRLLSPMIQKYLNGQIELQGRKVRIKGDK